MSTITTRAGKGSPLTNSEVDSNFTNLNDDKLEDAPSDGSQYARQDGAWATVSAGSSYGDSDVDTHLNVSSASNNQILSWNGTDYAWVTDQTGSGGGGVTSYTNLAGFPSSGNSLGDLGVAQDTKALYMWDGSSWDRIATGSDETPYLTTEPPTTLKLNRDGTTSTVTMVAVDPEGFDITYGIGYNTSGGTLPDQLGSATTINQSTGVYTFTPSTDTADSGDFKMRLTASDGNRVTVRTIDTTLVFYAAFSNLLARYDVGDSNSVTGTSTSWPDTSGKSAAAATIDHHSGNGAVETGTNTGVTVLNGGTSTSNWTDVEIPASVMSTAVSVGLIIAFVDSGQAYTFSKFNTSSSGGYYGYIRNGTSTNFTSEWGGSAYLNGTTSTTADAAFGVLKENGNNTKIHSVILDGATWPETSGTRTSIFFNGYNNSSFRNANFELVAIAVWDKSLTAQERKDFHDYYLDQFTTDKMAAWAG